MREDIRPRECTAPLSHADTAGLTWEFHFLVMRSWQWVQKSSKMQPVITGRAQKATDTNCPDDGRRGFLSLLFTWINSCHSLHPTRMLHWSPQTSSPNPFPAPWKVSDFPWKDSNWKRSRYKQCPLQPEWKPGDAGTSSSCFLHKINYNGQSVLLLSLLGKRWNGSTDTKAN